MSTHWLAAAATRAGFGDTSESGISAEWNTTEAWRRVCDHLKIESDTLLEGVAKVFRVEVADLDTSLPAVRAMLPETVAREFSVLPLRMSDREFTVATSEPLNFDAEREIGFVTSRRTVFEVAPPGPLLDAIERTYAGDETPSGLGAANLDAAHDRVLPDQTALQQAPAHTRDADVVKVTRMILFDAAKAGATEVHLSDGASAGRVQFKVDGRLSTFLRMPLATLSRVVDRLRGMAGIEDGPGRRQAMLAVRIDRVPFDIMVQTVPGYAHQLVLGLEGQVKEIPTGGVDERRHILVVDDDESGRLLMRTILEKTGFRVSEADDGETALPFLEEVEEIDAILLDLMMERMSGLDVLKTVRRSMKTAALPVVILTASERREDEHELLRAGADDYLRKPVDPQQLVERIRAVIKRARAYLD